MFSFPTTLIDFWVIISGILDKKKGPVMKILIYILMLDIFVLVIKL